MFQKNTFEDKIGTLYFRAKHFYKSNLVNYQYLYQTSSKSEIVPGFAKVLLHLDFPIQIILGKIKQVWLNNDLSIQGIISFNVATFGANDTFQPRSETLTGLPDEVLLHGRPCSVHRGFQLIFVTVAGLTGPCLNMCPNIEIKGVQIWRLWRPKVFGPEAHVSV